MVTFVHVRLFWDGINITERPHGTMHDPLSLPDGHLLHFMSYSTPWSGGGVHSNVIEVSVLSMYVTSPTGDGTPMKRKKMSTRMSLFCFYLLLP
jgi:hypothetical protein